MATIIINNETWAANGGVFTANSGDVFVIDPGLTLNTTINGATDFQVNFEESNPNAIIIATGQDSEPTFNWADGVDTSLTTIAANSSAATTFNVGDGATIYDVQGALLGPNDFTFGNDTTVVANIYGGNETDTLTTGSNFEVTYGSIILGRETDVDGQGDVINIGPDSFVNGWVQTGFGSDSITIGDGFVSNGSIVSYGSINGEPGSGDTIVIGDNVSIAGNIWMLGVAPGTDLDTISGTDDGTVNSLTIGENYTSSLGGIVGPYGELALTVGDNWDVAGVIYTYYGTDDVVLGSSADSPFIMVGQAGNDSLTLDHLNPDAFVQFDGGTQEGGAMDVLTVNNLTPDQLDAFETTLSTAGYTLGDDGLWHSGNPDAWETFYIGQNLYSDWETISVNLADGTGDGIVHGTEAADLITPGYTDAQGDMVDALSNSDGVFVAGTQAQVNTTTAGHQSGPVTVATADGGYFTVWYDEAYSDPAGQVHGQFFDASGNAVGNEVSIGTSVVEGWDVNEMPPLTATALDNGNIVVTWETQDLLNVDGSEAAVVQSIVSTDGTTTSATPESIVNTTTAGEQSGAVSVATADGGYFTTWYDAAYSDPAGQVHGQFFDANGNAVGDELDIGTSVIEGWDGNEMPPLTATALSNGNVVVTWETQDLLHVDGSEAAVVQSIVSTDGTTSTASPESIVNTTTAGEQSGAVTVATADGGYFTTWYDAAYSDPAGQVHGQFFDANGNAVGDELDIGTSPVEGWDLVDMPPLTAVALENGNVVVAWQTQDLENIDGSQSAVVQSVIGDSGNVGPETIINTTTEGGQSGPVLVALDNGGYFASWYDVPYGDPAGQVHGQYFDANGVPVGDELYIGTAIVVDGADGFDMPPLDVTALSDGRVVVSWQTQDTLNVDGDGTAVVQSLVQPASLAYGLTDDDVILAGDSDDIVDAGLGNDIVYAGSGSDVIDGNVGDDTLYGESGDDTLCGGDGADTLIGGDGADMLDGGDGDDRLIMGAGDTTFGGAGDDVFTVDASLTGNTPITVTGGETGEDLTDPTNGGDGDVLDLRGLGPVTVVYDTADPSYDPATGTGEAGTATYINAANYPVTITFSEIESVITDANGVVDGTTGADDMDPGYTDADGDMIDGTDGLDDVIDAGAGNDTVDAGLGNDTVDGGTGNDVLLGGAGDDTLLGGEGSDQLWGGEGSDLLDGGAGDDALVTGAGDTAFGGDGDDAFFIDGQSSGGTATIVGGEAGEDLSDPTNGGDGDYLDLGWDGNAVVTDAVDVTFSGDEAGAVTGLATDVTFSEIEQIGTGDGNDTIDASATTSGTNVYAGAGDDTLLGGSGDDTLDGGEGADSILAGDGSDTINGGDGDDLLDGGTGDDQLIGGLGNDTLIGGAGADSMDGGAGLDIVDYSGSSGAVNVDLSTNTFSGGDATGDVGYGIDGIIGSDFNDTLTGYDAEYLTGGPDDFTNIIDGGAGDDSIDGLLGSDTLIGGDGDDTIIGGGGDDTVTGDAGADLITGGTGDDVLTGGLDNDTFVYAAGDGADTITDFGNDVGTADDGDPTNNDLIDLSGFYSQANYDAAVANGEIDPNVIKNPLQWMRADLEDDNVLNGSQGDAGFAPGDSLTFTGVTAADLTTENTHVICFARGSRIATAAGEIPVEQLAVGDRVVTRDNGFQTIRWIGSTKRRAEGHVAPIMFREGVLGNHRSLFLSPNHRVLLRSETAQLLTGEHEVLVAAKFLVDDQRVLRVRGGFVEYFHILFDTHEVILSEGSWTESFHPGHVGMGSLCESARQEIFEFFPELETCTAGGGTFSTARMVINAREAALIANDL